MSYSDDLKLTFPGSPDDPRVVILTCCAPCVCATVKALCNSGFKPVLFFDNPNIFPETEYYKRRDEVRRIAALCGAAFAEGTYAPSRWQEATAGYENAPERGKRCEICFSLRLKRAAEYAVSHHIHVLTSVLGFSRWKSLSMADAMLTAAVDGFPMLKPWHVNWRKCGRQDENRRLIQEWEVYNQEYCGCFPSFDAYNKRKKEFGT